MIDMSKPIPCPPMPAASPAHLVTAVRLLRSYCGAFPQPNNLAGPHHGQARQSIVRALTGKKYPVCVCGVNAMRAALYAACGIVGDTPAARDRAFLAWADTHAPKEETP